MTFAPIDPEWEYTPEQLAEGNRLAYEEGLWAFNHGLPVAPEWFENQNVYGPGRPMDEGWQTAAPVGGVETPQAQNEHLYLTDQQVEIVRELLRRGVMAQEIEQIPSKEPLFLSRRRPP